jgi:uncharacterized membrane protein YdjX (TVP38/TMEM64 family)
MPDSHNTLRALGKTLEHAAEVVEDRIEDAALESREIAPLVDEARRVPWWGHVRRFWPLLLIAVAATVFVFSGAWRELHVDRLDDHYARLAHWSAAHPIGFRIGLVLALASLTAMGLPGGIVLVVAGGVFLGIVEGALYAVCADGIGATLLYFAARRAMTDGDNLPSSALVERLRGGFAQHPVSYALFLRLVPVFPFGAVSVALAWLGCRYRLFLLTSMAGVLPSLVVYAALGSSIAPTLAAHLPIDSALFSQPKFLLPLVVLGALSLIPVLLGLRRAPRIPR